jgi:ribosomal protein S1
MGNETEKSPRILSVVVTDSHLSGIHVKLPDGKRGFIRPREISWERRISVPAKLPEKGETVEAVILPEKPRGDSLLMSLRQCTDPWSEAIKAGKYKKEQIVEGEVVNTRKDGIYVQLGLVLMRSLCREIYRD